MLRQELRKNLHATVNGPGEVLLLRAHHPGDIVRPIPEVAVMALVFMDDGLHHLEEEGLIHPQELPMPGRPA